MHVSRFRVLSSYVFKVELWSPLRYRGKYMTYSMTYHPLFKIDWSLWKGLWATFLGASCRIVPKTGFWKWLCPLRGPSYLTVPNWVWGLKGACWLPVPEVFCKKPLFLLGLEPNMLLKLGFNTFLLRISCMNALPVAFAVSAEVPSSTSKYLTASFLWLISKCVYYYN